MENTTIIPPTSSDICENIDELELVHETVGSWRHGHHITEVYFRNKDNTYWQVSYEKSIDGESNGLRDGYALIERVWPIQTTITVYTKDLQTK